MGIHVSGVHAGSQSAPPPRVYASLREAIAAAVHGYGCMKALAAELDMAPSALSMATVLGDGDHVRGFPAEKVVAVEKLTGNLSPLATHAALLGHEIRPKAEVAAELLERAAHLVPELEAVLAGLRAMKGKP